VLKLTVLSVEDLTEHMYTYGEVRDRYIKADNPAGKRHHAGAQARHDGALIDIAAIAHLPN
jgi:hypothetical protein